MLITLYKNCILTDSYSEVFDVFHKDINGKTPLERYLATLEHKDITAGDVYVTGSGKISFMLTADDGDFINTTTCVLSMKTTALHDIVSST